MKPALVIQEIYEAALDLPEPYDSLSPEEKKAARKLWEQFEQLETKFGKVPHADLVRPMLLSKNGCYDEAIAFTEERYRQTPN